MFSLPLDSFKNWPAPSSFPALKRAEAHVWIFDLSPSSERFATLRSRLSPDELKRADRFRFEKDQISFASARGHLRECLGGYLGQDPCALIFQYNSFGKPLLSSQRSGDLPKLDFNVSHSHGLALIAVTREGDVGVDIEQIRSSVMGERIADRFFSPAEVASLTRIPAEGQADAFFACWTRKEAYIKARGDGLSRSLDTFSVSLGCEEEPRLLWSKDDPEVSTRWQVHRLPVPLGYAGSLVVSTSVASVKRWLGQ